ncbi:MAG: protein kinase [Isosphaeraceae bacterium]|nr:protein kinase [Isosphaeraceae bacterium]
MTDPCLDTEGPDSLGFGGSTGHTRRHPPSYAGRRIGRYLLIEPLGAGSQAVVWRALQDQPVPRLVALKLLVPGRQLDPRSIARLHREAERGARLAHPALLPVEEFGRDEGAVFLAMPLVEGCALDEIIAQRRRRQQGRAASGGHWLAALPEADYDRALARVLARIARALQAAHEAQIAHRDIKAANILLEWGRAGRAYLIDFGVGRDLDVATAEQLRDGAGTPLYMPPEKLLGRPCDEISSDLYALGVTLFEAATLTRPFRVPEGMPRPLWGPYLAELRPPRPHTVRPGLPAALAAIIDRAMARDPQARYPSASALAEDLERFAQDGGDRRRPGAAHSGTPRAPGDAPRGPAALRPVEPDAALRARAPEGRRSPPPVPGRPADHDPALARWVRLGASQPA